MIKKICRKPLTSPDIDSEHHFPVNRSILLLLLTLASAGLFITEKLNQSLFLTLNTFLSQLPDIFWVNMTNLGSTLAGAALLCLLLPKRPQLALHLLISGVLCTLVIYGLKHALDVVRPHLILDRSLFHFIETSITSPARPSGHTATGFFIAGTVWYLLQSRALRLGSLLLAILIGLSRIAIGVHWPLDLIWGALIGLGMGHFGAFLITRLTSRRNRHEAETQGAGYWILSLGLICFISAYFIVKPLPYAGENFPSLTFIYLILTMSFLGCIRTLRGRKK